MKKIYLVRHAETESNRKGIFRGRLDIPLSIRGKEQALDLGRYFKSILVDRIYTSPLSRAIKTAEIAFPGRQPVVTDSLNNLDLGKWSGLEKEVVKEEFPQQWHMWVRHPESITFPNGEGLNDVYCRVTMFLEQIENDQGDCIVAVTHRSVAKVLLASAIKLEKNYYWKFHLDNTSVSLLIFEIGRGWTIAKLNETGHLKEVITEWY